MMTQKLNFIEWIVLATTLAILVFATKIGIETLIKFTCEFPGV